MDEQLLNKAVCFDHIKIVTDILLLVPKNNRIHFINVKGVNPLQFAIKLRRWEIVSVIFNSLTDEAQSKALEICDNDGKNLLHYLAEFGKNGSDHSVIEIITNRSSNLINSLDNENKTPLHYAARHSNLKILKLYMDLLSPEAFLEELIKPDSKDNSPLYYAILFGDPEVNKFFVNYTTSIYNKFNEFSEKIVNERFTKAKFIKKNIKTLLPPTSKLLPKFKVREADNHLYLMTKNKNDLHKYRNWIIEYTHKVDPQIKIEDLEIKKVKDDADLKLGYKHFIELEKILPSTVAAAYGLQHGNVKRNCHGTALLVSGVVKQLAYFENPFRFAEFREYFEEIPVKDISNGDLVYLKGLKGDNSDHSFIYLSPDFCLSMNGCLNKKLKFYSTESVLNRYGYPKESLDNNKWTDNLAVYRKLSNEEIIQETVKNTSLNKYIQF